MAGKGSFRRDFLRIRPSGEDHLIVEFSYAPERVAKIKTVPGRQWHPEGKYWTVPRVEGMVEQLLDLFAGERVEVEPMLQPARDVVQETLRAVEDELKLRGYSPRTLKAYRRIAWAQEPTGDAALHPREQ